MSWKAERRRLSCGRRSTVSDVGDPTPVLVARCEREGKEQERRSDDLRRSLKAAHLGKSLLSMTAAVNMPAFTVTMPAAMIQSCR